MSDFDDWYKDYDPEVVPMNLAGHMNNAFNAGAAAQIENLLELRI